MSETKWRAGTSGLTVIVVVRSESVRNIIRERRMLEHLNHAFLCNLRYSFQDIEYLYVTSVIFPEYRLLLCSVTDHA